jgi:hypothetical protein
MRLHGNASGAARRRLLGMTMTAGLAVTLAACSSSSSTTTAPAAGTKASPAAAAAAASAPASPAAVTAGRLSGKWSGQYSGAFQGTFALTWHQSGSKLSGRIRISDPGNTLPIHGRVQGGSIRFGTVGSTVITYSGSVSGNSMSGTYKVRTPNGPVGGPWSASKS